MNEGSTLLAWLVGIAGAVVAIVAAAHVILNKRDVRAAIGKLRGALGQGVGELQKAATKVDPTLKGTVQHLRSQAFAALDDVEKKVTAAVKRESEITLSQLEKAQLHLFPNGKPAECVQSPLYFLTRYGDAVLDGLYDAFEVNFE